MSQLDPPSTEYRTRIYETFTDSDRETADQVETALAIGRDRLDLGLGFLTRITDGTQRITHVTGADDAIRPGATCPLDEAYCRQTVEGDGLLSAHDAASSELIGERALERFELGSYIGSKVTVDDELYGTVCFADAAPREAPFSEAEELFVELVARQVGHAIERQSHEAELQRRNRRLAAEKARFQSIAENSFDVIFRLDEAGRFTYLSPSAAAVIDLYPADLEGERFTDFLAEDSVARGREAFERVRDGESVQHVELQFLDGSETRTLEVNAVPVADDEVALQGVARDVTLRQSHEREIRIKTRAMERADVGIAITEVREDLPITYVNEAFSAVTGYDESEAVGRPAPELIGPKTDADVAERVYAAIESREPVAEELLAYRADGRPFWAQLSITPVTDEVGTVTHLVGILDDVTDRHRTARLIQVLNRTLRHNLRNDMNVLLIDGDRMRQADDETVGAIADRVARTAQDLVDLSERARNLEQYANQPRNPVRIHPGDLLEPITGQQAESHPGADLSVDVETDRDVCAGSEVEAALVELFDNALDHHPGDAPVVRVAVEDAGEDLRITLADDGPGISQAEADVIAAGEETDLEHGSGLGLWLVNWIVTRYGGSFQIRAGEALGLEGTVATILLPAVDDGEDPEQACRPPTPLFT